jgi:methylthioribulose-1-phosphate dehydratase
MAEKPESRRRGQAKAPANRKACAAHLVRLGREFHSRGWALGTSGNYSAVLRRNPLRLLITSSGLDKSRLTGSSFLEIGDQGQVVSGPGKPSAEALLHLAVARGAEAGAILHTHSVWNTLVSEGHEREGGVAISGYEMLKGLEGVRTHRHREWIPIFENDQDIPSLAQRVKTALEREPGMHGFLLSGHGLYTWGVDLAQARRHIEIFEFLLEVSGRREFGAHPVRP